jgi:hypothetical protein
MTDANRATLHRLWLRVRLPLLIYLVTATAYAVASGSRMKKPSRDNHYVYLAQSLLKGRLSLEGAPPHGNDWAVVHELTLRDGRRVRGTYLKTGGNNLFKTTAGERLVIEPSEIRSRRRTYFVSFPWFPALLMLPFVAVWGLKFNDVIFNVALAPCNAVLVFLLLRRLGRLGYSNRSLLDDLWLTGLFAFGTVHFFASVVGQVWFTAHVVGVGLTALYALSALEGRHPFRAGLCLGLGFVTRTPVPFSFPLLLGEILRRHLKPADAASGQPCLGEPVVAQVRALWPRVQLRPTLRDLAWGAAPAVAVAAVAFWLNDVRFDSPFEFGHYFLDVRWTERIQRWGLFNYHFISRNLAAMLCLLPRILTRPPFVQVSHHGLSIFFTTPIFSYLLWPQRRNPLQPWLYLSCLFPLILHLMYQHTGWQQFGYRFSLDYTVYLIALLAIGGYRLALKAKLLIVFSVVVNSFGAATFSKAFRYFWDGGMFWVS